MGASAREAAVQLLQQVETGERHSGEALDALLRRTVLSPADQALVSRLFYGVLERRLTLDYVLSACSSVKLKKMHPPCAITCGREHISCCTWIRSRPRRRSMRR